MLICFCLMFIWSVELTLRRYRTAITSDKVYRSYHFSEILTGFIIKRGDYSCDKTTANLWNSRSFVPKTAFYALLDDCFKNGNSRDYHLSSFVESLYTIFAIIQQLTYRHKVIIFCRFFADLAEIFWFFLIPSKNREGLLNRYIYLIINK